jgi:predicted nucleotidyltransferase
MMTATRIPSELAPYLERLVEVLTAEAPIEAVFLVGSAAVGGYEHGRSDVDVVAVTTRSLSLSERRALAAAVADLPVPARKLELVVYPHGSDRWELNLNSGEHVGVDADAEPSFWFVLDRAIAEQHAVPLAGPPWGELFTPEPAEAIEAALAEVAAFDGWDEPARDAELAAVRAQVWRETGRWVSKREAAERLS